MELQVIVFSSCYIYWLREGTIKLEFFRKILAKLTGLAVRIYSKKPKGKNTMKEKKMEVVTPGFEPAPQLPLAKKVRLLTTHVTYDSCDLCDRCTSLLLKLIVLKYLSLPFRRFEPYGTVFIMNSKIQFEKKIVQMSISKPFCTISVFIHSRALYRPLD